ncbi:MAG: hypothetical protein ABI114_11475 [Rhodanobacter sp.]
MNKMTYALCSVFAFLTMPAAAGVLKAAPFDVLSMPSFSVELSRGGGLVIQNGGDRYNLESRFSYPYMKPNKWNELIVGDKADTGGEWHWEAARNGNVLEITGVSARYQLHRKIGLSTGRVVITDTFTNTSHDDIAVVFNNTVSPQQAPREMYVAGVSGTSLLPNDSEAPSTNPSLFYQGATSGFGMVALDDFFRLQLSIRRDGNKGVFADKNFGLPPGGSYSFSWAIYPTHTANYYDFVNAVRHDYVAATRVEGGLAFMPYDFVTSQSREVVAKWLAMRSAKVIIFTGPYSGFPWLGGYGHYLFSMPKTLNEKSYLDSIKAAVSVIRSIDPTIKCLVPFETALTPDQPAGSEKPVFLDSVAIGSDGTPMGYRFPKTTMAREAYIRNKAHSFIYYPTLSNSYYKSMRRIIGEALNTTGVDGIYFDVSTYTKPGFRWTYDRWDQRTVDVDLTNYTIRRKKSDLAKVSEDARAAIIQMVLSSKAGNVVVTNGIPLDSKGRALPVMHFIETAMNYGYAQTQLASTPIVLGWTNGYRTDALRVGKKGTWWKGWSSDADYFADIREKIASGNLYFTYWAPPGQMYKSSLTRPTILAHMFPITITKLGSGTIVGQERIITLHSGTYSWGDKAAAKAYFYDGQGQEISGKMTVGNASGGPSTFGIEVPSGGAAIIERRP